MTILASVDAGPILAYALLFVAVAICWAGIPFVGAAALGVAGAAASQGRLDITVVAIVGTMAGEVGGLIGYAIGVRWGRTLLDRPGRHQAGRAKLLAQGERAYARWGPVAVFLTPAIVSGTAKMNYRRFMIWNLVASLTFAVSIGHTADGLVRIVTGHHGGDDLAVLLLGLAAGTAFLVFMIRRRRHRVRTVTA